LAAAGADLLDVPDKPGASVSRDAAVVAAQLQEHAGKPAIVHRAAIHGNLLEAHSALIGYGDLGLHGVLALTGDPPSIGPLGSVATRVGDLKSSVELLRLIRTLREGTTVAGEPIRDPPDLCAGCAVGQPTPAHLEWLRRKLDAGAEFVFSQPVFDRDSAERLLEAVTPLTARLFVGLMPLVSRKNAEFLAQGRIPGIRAPEALAQAFARYERAEDQRRFGLDLAADLTARLVRAARGLYLIPPFGKRGYADAAQLVRLARAAR
jgi:homocysteine S-methyltransferase